jgi:hypothetical protein
VEVVHVDSRDPIGLLAVLDPFFRNPDHSHRIFLFPVNVHVDSLWENNLLEADLDDHNGHQLLEVRIGGGEFEIGSLRLLVGVPPESAGIAV